MTATDSNGGVIVREVYIEATQETVFAFFTDPDKMTRWMGVSATLEPQVDGLYLVNIAKGTVAKGEYREVLPNSRIAFSFGWEAEGAGGPPVIRRARAGADRRSAVVSDKKLKCFRQSRKHFRPAQDRPRGPCDSLPSSRTNRRCRWASSRYGIRDKAHRH